MRERLKEILMHAVSEFINRESNRQSMITVTNVSMGERNRRATVFVSVFPEAKTQAACEFLNRKRSDLREYLKKHTKLSVLPHVTFLPSPTKGGVEEETSM